MSKREVALALHLHLEKTMQQFLKRCSRPGARYEYVTTALEEVTHERLMLEGKLSGVLSTARQTMEDVRATGNA